ncbi:MAG: hypothetical protein HFH40_04195 [Lachnospiraceae bacterium]|nr:hypothetical protein [Lachnospiraceae bacterium]
MKVWYKYWYYSQKPLARKGDMQSPIGSAYRFFVAALIFYKVPLSFYGIF